MELEIKQRSYDSKWVLWGYAVDKTIEPVRGQNGESYFFKKWTILGIFDDEIEAKKERHKFL